jgi:hypothetical protein
MKIKKPYEMTFVEFAEAIIPGWMVNLANPSKRQLGDAEWLTTVWNSADNRLTYCVYWANDILKNELPPEMQSFQIDDLSLHPITKNLGLDPASKDDNIKASELLATRDAWIGAIKQHYVQSATDIPTYTLTDAAAAEYVLLTSGFQHPWIQRKVLQHIAVQSRKNSERAEKVDLPTEMSNDPNWPNAQVIHARASELAASALTECEEKKKDIDYWLNQFISEDGCWSSEFEIHAYDAQCDIDIANQKIAALQKIIEKQKSLIRDAELIIKRNKRHEATMRASNKIGRPEKSAKRQEMSKKFTSQWVESLIDVLDVKSCAQLEIVIDESNERNWRRWRSGERVPTHNNFSKLLNSEIMEGPYIGKLLHEVPTIPRNNDLLKLISLT